MASAIEDVSNLPGETIHDQEGRKFGEVKEIYAVGDGTPMWVTVEASTGIGRSRRVFIPIARLKHEQDEIRTPYSVQHLYDSPEVEGDELSDEDDRSLRGFYGIGVGDGEMVSGATSYASQLPDEDEAARQIEASEAEGMVRDLDERSPAERAEEADDASERERGDGDGQKASAADVLDADKDKDGEDKPQKDQDGEDKSEND